MATKKKAKKPTAVRSLKPKHTKAVKGGRKAGEGQKEFLVVKLNEVFISQP